MIGTKVNGMSVATETVIEMVAETGTGTENEGIATENGLAGIETARRPSRMMLGAPRAKVAALMVV